MQTPEVGPSGYRLPPRYDFEDTISPFSSPEQYETFTDDEGAFHKSGFMVDMPNGESYIFAVDTAEHTTKLPPAVSFTPYVPSEGYRVDQRDFDPENRTLKALDALSQQSPTTPETSNLLTIEHDPDSEYYLHEDGLIDFEPHYNFSDEELKTLPNYWIVVRLQGQTYVSRPQIDKSTQVYEGKPAYNLVYDRFFPIDVGDLPSITVEDLRDGQPIRVPVDPNVLQDLKIEFKEMYDRKKV